MDAKAHWNVIYERGASSQLGWFQPHLRSSLDLISRAGLSTSSPIIDIGGGDSTLVDDLITQGYEDITVLDISPAALARAKARLGPNAERVHWIESDILQAELPSRHYDLWHDRALFHFFIQEPSRAAYVETLLASLAPRGAVILATFAPDGPSECSGLPTSRYGHQDFLHSFGHGFELEASLHEDHTTPSGTLQRYAYAMIRSMPAA